jgi:hypothetical protein
MGCVQAWSAHGDLWWRNFESSGQASWQARVGREIERYKREREEEMRKQQGGGGETRASSMFLHHW